LKGLSVACFILRLHEFCQIQPGWRLQMMTNNQGLLTRVKKNLPFPEPYPNITLAFWQIGTLLTKLPRPYAKLRPPQHSSMLKATKMSLPLMQLYP
jgi:hypothetical protein